MKHIIYSITILCIALLFSGCYHAQITTELEPSNQTIEKSFASSWIYGLIPPSTVRAQEECRSGVAKVETKLSFVNNLVGMITFGIYTPMNIKVTCAASRASLDLNRDNTITVIRDQTDVIESFKTASDRAVNTQKPVYVEFK